MLDTACPSQETLRRYLQGNFDLSEVDSLEEHLDQCPVCEETVSALEDTTDTLMRHLPLAAGSAEAERDAPAWIQRLKAGPPVVDQHAPQAAAEVEPRIEDRAPARHPGLRCPRERPRAPDAGYGLGRRGLPGAGGDPDDARRRR